MPDLAVGADVPHAAFSRAAWVPSAPRVPAAGHAYAGPIDPDASNGEGTRL
jgi:hypothetical protein